MSSRNNPPAKDPIVLMVDDDPDDVFLTQRAFKGINWKGRFQSVGSAEEMFAYLGLGDEDIETPVQALTGSYPDIVILDLNMPRMDGFQVLQKIRSNAHFAHLPIVVLSTSDLEEDIDKAYRLGANSFITKPVTTAGMVRLAERFRDYWFELSRLPALSG